MSAAGEEIRPPAPLGRRDAAICLLVGVVAILIAGLQPVVLGGLAREGRLTEAQIGLAATVELLALGAACGLAAAFLKPVNVRAKMIAACLAHAGTMAAATLAAGWGAVALRGAAGGFAGLMLWMAISMISRAERPERSAGIFVTLQTLAQLALAALLPATVATAFGTNGILLTLAAISVAAALAVAAGPRAFAPLPRSETGGARLEARTWAGLAAAFLHLAFIVALWVYLEPLAALSGLSPQQAGLTVAGALGMQVLGGACATLVGRRQPAARTLIIVGLLNIVILAVLWSQPAPVLFAAAVAVFGFLWLFALPFYTLLLIQLDPTRRGAMQLGTAQLLGSSFGPLAASAVVAGGGVHGAVALSAGLLAATLAVISGLSARRRGAGVQAADSRG